MLVHGQAALGWTVKLPTFSRPYPPEAYNLHFDVMADNIGGGLCGLGGFLLGVEPVFEPAISALRSQVGSGRW